MRITYTPEGADPQVFEFKPGKLMSPEAEAIERHTGLTYKQFTEALGETSVLATHALLYVFLKRGNPTLKYDQIQFCMDEIEIDLDDDEAANAITELRRRQADRPLTDDEAEAMKQLEERGLAEALTEVAADPKALPPAKSSD